jgi:antitoxin Phd_YefM of type II toxin-antitoxin system
MVKAYCPAVGDNHATRRSYPVRSSAIVTKRAVSPFRNHLGKWRSRDYRTPGEYRVQSRQQRIGGVGRVLRHFQPASPVQHLQRCLKCGACRSRRVTVFVSMKCLSFTTSRMIPSKYWRLSKNRWRTSGSKGVVADVKDDLSRYLRLAAKEEIVITRHGKPAGVLVDSPTKTTGLITAWRTTHAF